MGADDPLLEQRMDSTQVPLSPIFLDHGATTPCDPRVLDAMRPYFRDLPFDPTGSVHPAARQVDDAVSRARALVAGVIGAEPREVVFTSGATESNNLAIQGLARTAGQRRRIVITAVEHKSVLAPCRDLTRHGFEVIELPVERDGRVDLGAAAAAIDERTLLVSIQAANGELGTIQPVGVLAAMAHRRGAFVHCDGAQAVGRTPLDVRSLDVDLLSLSAHKCYGPKGIGGLYIRGGPYALPLHPLLLGGGQERGLRGGTLNVPAIIGFGEACRLCSELLPTECRTIAGLRDAFEQELQALVAGISFNAQWVERLPGHSSVTLPGVEAEALIANMPDVVVGTGASCVAGAPEPSYVLLATGLDGRDAYRTIRLAFGRFNTPGDPAYAAQAIASVVARLRDAR